MGNNLSPRIYVACLAAYNNGKLHGEWIDADLDAEDIHAEIQAMLENSPEPNAEEWAIHDSEDFGDLTISEHEDIETISRIAQLLVEHGEAFAAYASNGGIDFATEDGFLDSYEGEYDSEEDFAEETAADIWNVPDWLEMYIDWERVARDWFCGDFYSIDNGSKVFVFRNC